MKPTAHAVAYAILSVAVVGQEVLLLQANQTISDQNEQMKSATARLASDTESMKKVTDALEGENAAAADLQSADNQLRKADSALEAQCLALEDAAR